MGPSTPLDKEIKSGGFSPQGNNGHPSYYGHISLPPLPVESESRVSSMTIADVSPRLALKKVRRRSHFCTGIISAGFVLFNWNLGFNSQYVTSFCLKKHK